MRLCSEAMQRSYGVELCRDLRCFEDTKEHSVEQSNQRLHVKPTPVVTVRCSAVVCFGVQCCALPCSAVQCCAVQCSGVQWCAVQCSVVQWCAVQCSAVTCCSAGWSRANLTASHVVYSPCATQLPPTPCQLLQSPTPSTSTAPPNPSCCMLAAHTLCCCCVLAVYARCCCRVAPVHTLCCCLVLVCAACHWDGPAYRGAAALTEVPQKVQKELKRGRQYTAAATASLPAHPALYINHRSDGGVLHHVH